MGTWRSEPAFGGWKWVKSLVMIIPLSLTSCQHCWCLSGSESGWPLCRALDAKWAPGVGDKKPTVGHYHAPSSGPPWVPWLCASCPQSLPASGSFPTLRTHVWLFCDPMHCSLPDSSFHGFFQARTLEWVAIPFSRGNLPDAGIESMSPASPALAGIFFVTAPPRKPSFHCT